MTPCLTSFKRPQALHHSHSGAPRILLVEDDVEIARLLRMRRWPRARFEPHGRAIRAGDDDARLRRHQADLIILDVMLPGEDGTSICRRLRNSSDLPIIMLTALGEDVDRILGLESRAPMIT